MPSEDREALLRHYGEMRAELLAAIDRLSDEQLTERTIDGWSVKDHLAHLALWDELRASEVERISAGFETTWRMQGRDGEYSGLGYDMRRDLSQQQVRWESSQTHQRLLDAIAAATERGLDGSLYGEAGLKSTHEAAHTAWIRYWRTERGY
jgi:uncharacterized damage-inducible protein DinB